MVAIGPNLRSGGGKFREIAEEMCGKEDITPIAIIVPPLDFLHPDDRMVHDSFSTIL
jgi:hypothetical protein